MLETHALENPEPLRGGQSLHLLNQPGLANPRLTDYVDEGALPEDCVLQEQTEPTEFLQPTRERALETSCPWWHEAVEEAQALLKVGTRRIRVMPV